MEGSFEGDLRVVEKLSIEFHFGTAGASAEEIDRAALANHVNRPLPCLRTAHGLDYHIRSTLLRREHANSADGIIDACDLHGFVGSKSPRILYLLIALDDGDNAQTAQLCDLHEHEPNRSRADDDNTVSPLRMGLIQSMKNAS